MRGYRSGPSRLFLFLICVLPLTLSAQMITGSWMGKINRQRVEVKIIQTGDSLTGTSYYFESHNNYRRYSIKGYFDQNTNSVVWWDDQLLEEKSSRFSLSSPGKMALLSRADFNCPGGNRMMLDGKAGPKESDEPSGEVHLDKTANPEFKDEWDFVIANYTIGANDPYIIDSIGSLSRNPVSTPTPVFTEPEKTSTEIVSAPAPVQRTVTAPPKNEIPAETVSIQPAKPVSIEEKFTSRKKVLVKEFPLTGDTLELRFYDNAEIDGDSISLFLNGKLLFQHIRLTGNAYTIKIPVSELNETNELIMVAENLGTIPPNTSYMLAIVGENRYDAYLASTEGSSAMIRFVKKPTAPR